jgi:ABC-type phosphate transport system substrate-binding protein
MGVRHFAVAVLAGFLGTCSALPVAAQSLDVAVVVNPSNPVANVTTDELRKIFAGEKHSWPRGLPIKLAEVRRGRAKFCDL